MLRNEFELEMVLDKTHGNKLMKAKKANIKNIDCKDFMTQSTMDTFNLTKLSALTKSSNHTKESNIKSNNGKKDRGVFIMSSCMEEISSGYDEEFVTED